MITKTYLDGRLNNLEEKLERRIGLKDERLLHGIEANVVELKNNIKSLEERFDENRNLIVDCLQKYDDLKQEIEKLKLKIDSAEKITEMKENQTE